MCVQKIVKDILVVLLVLLCFASCKNDVLPKPKAMLRLAYSRPTYNTEKLLCGFSFDKNEEGVLNSILKNGSCASKISYPKLNATIFLTYREINNDLKKLLTDAQNLTQEHVVKADDIRPREYVNKQKKVYGMSYEVVGDAASPAQFYVTDSVRNFLLGSVYFRVKPNYDSILPAAEYLRNDMRVLMESIEW